MAEGILGLGHADGQLRVAQLREGGEGLLRGRCITDLAGTVDFGGQPFDLVLEGEIGAVEQRGTGGPGCRLVDGLR